jgi:hypothetical protein
MVDGHRGLVGGEADRLGVAERGDDLREDPRQLAAQQAELGREDASWVLLDVDAVAGGG